MKADPLRDPVEGDQRGGLGGDPSVASGGEVPIKAIARRLGVSRNAVRRAFGGTARRGISGRRRGRWWTAFEPAIRELLVATPTMPATVIAERIGWTRSMTVLKDRVRVLRPLFVPPDPASRTEYSAGERMQCDLWFPPVDVPLGFGQVGRPPVLVMVAGYSRMIFAVMIPSRQAPDLMAGHWLLLQRAGAVPRALVVGQRVRGRFVAGRQAEADRRLRGVPRDAGHPGASSAARVTRRPRAWSSGPTATWRPRSCPVGRSPRRRTSTPSCEGWLVLANTRSCAGSAGCRPSGGQRTGPPCWPCRRWRR